MLRGYTLLYFVLTFFSAVAQNYPASPQNYVTDDAGLLTSQEQQQLNDKLAAFEKTTSSQIFIYIAPSLNGADMSDLCYDIFHSWKIGTEALNNGVLIAVFVNDHQFRIQTGYGMEGALPDLLTKRIQDQDMRPYFKEGKYFEGLSKGSDKLIYYSQHEFEGKALIEEKDGHSWVNELIINAILLGFLIYRLFRKAKLEQTLRKKVLRWGIFAAVLPVLGTLILIALIGVAFGLNYKRIFGNFKRRKAPFDRRDGDAWLSSGSYDSSFSSDNDSGSSSDFDGGGGGDSGGGGSSSDW